MGLTVSSSGVGMSLGLMPGVGAGAPYTSAEGAGVGAEVSEC